MNRRLLDIVVCPTCKASAFSYRRLSRAPEDAVLLCRRCKEWYIIEDGILELLPSALNDERRRMFFDKHRRQIMALRVANFRDVPEDAASQQKKSQMHFFDEFSSHYILETHTFWKAYYSLFFERFFHSVPQGSWVLDVGCGTGLGSLPFFSGDYTVVGVDLSREMLKKAISRIPIKQRNRHMLFVADAEHLPFKPNLFDVCIGMGILHHVHDLKKVVRSVAFCLKKGGIYVGHENNKTLFRPLFDLLMKVHALWHEEAGEEQLLSARDLQRLFRGFHVNASTHVFLPPHFFNFFRLPIAKKILHATDKLCSNIPVLKNNGGTIVFQARKD